MQTAEMRAPRWRQFIDPAILFVLLALAWEKAVDVFGIKRYLLPPLSQVLDSLWTQREVLLAQSWVTTREVLAGYQPTTDLFPSYHLPRQRERALGLYGDSLEDLQAVL